MDPRTPLLAPVPARVAGLLALTAFGAGHWMLLLEPPAHRRAAAAVGIAALVAVALLGAGRLRGPARAAGLAATVAGGLLCALLAGGVPAEQLRPREWDLLVRGLAAGVAALPGSTVPYRGIDEDLARVLALGGILLALLATLLACWPREARDGRRRIGFPLGALIALVGLYAVPAVSLVLAAEFLRGALLAVLVLAFLRLDRLPGRDAPAALAAAGVVTMLALVAAPALDTEDPWFDYEAWAEDAAGARSAAFDWRHDYGALLWPRDGRELLRIASKQRSYWKTDDLDVFDGQRWTQDRVGYGRNHSGILFGGVGAKRFRRWSFDVRVSVRSLRSSTLPVAGSPQVVELPGREATQIRPGVWSVGRPVRRGDAYRAQVYLPQPSARDLASAGTAYGPGLVPYTEVQALPPEGAGAGPTARVLTEDFFGGPPVLPDAGGVPAGDALAGSGLRRVHRLSRRLLAGAATPYAYVQAVKRHLADGFRYDETPPLASRTLDGFLFEGRAGFCQHYSGAMALLLRLGGVPARVATGFAPGSFDERAKEYVVRDIDAHSWVEAFFPGIGWVTFDPTPAAAPPRSQALNSSPTAASGDIRDVGTTQAPPAVSAKAGDAGPPWALLAAGGVVLVGAALGGPLVRRRLRRPAPSALGELERALRAAGQSLPPGLTLRQLEARSRRSPAVAAYAAALRAARYAPAGGGPTAADRRALRRALSRGRGPVAKARTWLALPPRIRPGRRGEV